jgi:hypothetical protein
MFSRLGSIVVVALCAGSASAAPCAETAKTPAALKCVEDHWQHAFLTGDGTYLTALLSDDYRTYTAAGVGKDRAAVVAMAQAYAKKHPGEPAASPTTPGPDIQLHGDTAAIFWHNGDGTLSSVDAFVWANGRWRAWYSQHAQEQPAKPDAAMD